MTILRNCLYILAELGELHLINVALFGCVENYVLWKQCCTKIGDFQNSTATSSNFHLKQTFNNFVIAFLTFQRGLRGIRHSLHSRGDQAFLTFQRGLSRIKIPFIPCICKFLGETDTMASCIGGYLLVVVDWRIGGSGHPQHEGF